MTRRRGSRRGVIRMALLFAAFLASLSLVVWRQSMALELLRSIDGVRSDRAVVEARRVSLIRRLDGLESRARIARVAQERFGMRLPHGDEIVLLPLDGPTPVRAPVAPPAPTMVADGRATAGEASVGGSPAPPGGGPLADGGGE